MSTPTPMVPASSAARGNTSSRGIICDAPPFPSLSPPRKRGSRAREESVALDARFRGHDKEREHREVQVGMTAGPRIIDPLPEPVEIVDAVWITMADGCRLAARLWLPTSARKQPVPAILEYIPYRRRD